MGTVLLEARPYRPFKSSEEYLYAMKEDLAEWLNTMYPELDVNVDNFMDKLETGVVLCKHANNVRKQALEYLARKQFRKMSSSAALAQSVITRTAIPVTEMGDISFKSYAKPGTFFARDNVSNFIDFARKGLEIIECLLFETEDLIMRKNEKNVILCLLEVARKGARYGMLAPILIQMEREIDREIAAERGDTNEFESSEDEDEHSRFIGPIPQIVTNDLKSLDEMVRDLVEKCSCPTQFPMIRVSEGKYRIGDTKVLIFVRILRSHVMVRVGGGWDTLSHYLDKHDPCRCRNAHRAALSSKLILKNTATIELNNAFVHYERSPPRTRRSSASSSSSGNDPRDLLTASPIPHRNRSPSPSTHRETSKSLNLPKYVSSFHFDRSTSPSPSIPRGRSRSPNYSASLSSAKNPTRGRSRTPNSAQPNYISPTLASRNRSRSPSIRPLQLDVETQRAKVRIEANYEDKQQNDSGSEVSDEGYRSLGLIVTSPTLGEGKIILSENSAKAPFPIARATSEEDNDDKSTIKDSESCHSSREASVDSIRSSPSRSRRSSLMDDTQSSRRRSSLTRSRSASSSENLSLSPRKTPSEKKKKTDAFQRGCVGRSSLGASTISYDPLTGRKIKTVSPLLTDLLAVENTEDDKAILLKMKELISQYSCMLDGQHDDDMSKWDGEEKSGHRRKDSRYDGAISKIPAPVYYKQPASEKEY